MDGESQVYWSLQDVGLSTCARMYAGSLEDADPPCKGPSMSDVEFL